MALIQTGPGYTRTGNSGQLSGFFNNLANKASFIPWIGGGISAALGTVGTSVEAVGWLLRGKPLSAATVAVTGYVGHGVNALTSVGDGINPLYWVNLGSGALTGRSIGTHARALTEGGLGMATGALGVRPTVLRSHVAGIGSMGGGMGAGPRRDGFLANEAARRGQSVDQAWARVNGNQGDHVADLRAAQARGPQQQGI